MDAEQEPARKPSATGNDDLVVDIARLRASMLSLAGGKAANLGELASAGLPVPGGFCITTEAYRRAVARPEVDDLLDQLAGVGRGQGNGRVLVLADRIRSAVRMAPVPPAVEAAVRQAYVALGPRVPVAGRATAPPGGSPVARLPGRAEPQPYRA